MNKKIYIYSLFISFFYRVESSDVFKQTANHMLFRTSRPKGPVVSVRTDEKTKLTMRRAINFVRFSEDLACEDSVLRKMCLKEDKEKITSLIDKMCEHFYRGFSQKNVQIPSLEFYSIPKESFAEVSEDKRLSYTSNYIIKRLLTVWAYVKTCCENHNWSECLRTLQAVSARSPLIYGDGTACCDAAIWFFKLIEDGPDNIYF